MSNRFTHNQLIDRLANLAVRVGVNVQPGQQLVMTASTRAMPLARAITQHAYEAGASLVTTLFTDEACTLSRYTHGADNSFDHAPAWLFEGMAKAFEGGAARLAISGDNPGLLAGQDSNRVSRADRARAIAYKPAGQQISDFKINWNIVASATPGWAAQIFPGLPPQQAMRKLWKAIFAASRVDVADPVAAWNAHNATLHARSSRLNEKRYASLRFMGPGTDLTVGLADDHLWAGGAEPAKNGVICNPNIPTEEVFTTPHLGRVNGWVSSTKPLSVMGTVVQGIRVRFENGRAVEVHAESGEDVLRRLVSTDEGAARLGEVALVPHSSPISQSGLLFFNTLFDENAACHIAFGQAYSTCVKDGGSLTKDELTARGANSSNIHVDWMIGSGQVDVDGITADGVAEPIMRQGEFV